MLVNLLKAVQVISIKRHFVITILSFVVGMMSCKEYAGLCVILRSVFESVPNFLLFVFAVTQKQHVSVYLN